jgi:hypothetical protein
VAGGISFRAADIQDDVTGLAGLQVLVDIPAVGFEFEQFFEVFEGGFLIGDIGDWISIKQGHIDLHMR